MLRRRGTPARRDLSRYIQGNVLLPCCCLLCSFWVSLLRPKTEIWASACFNVIIYLLLFSL